MREDNGINIISQMEQVIGRAQIVDLTYTMEPGMPVWPTQARYGTVVYESYDFGDAAIHSAVTMSEHTGTHIDAPKHFIKGACPIDQLDLRTVMGRGVLVDVTGIGRRELVTLDRLKQFENQNGMIRTGDIVMIRFGWDEKYALQPDCGDYLKDWPGLSGEAAEYMRQKGVTAVGCDTLSLDGFGSDNICHQILLSHGIPIIENLKHLSRLPVFTYVMGLPNKFKDGSGSPIRMVAFMEQQV